MKCLVGGTIDGQNYSIDTTGHATNICLKAEDKDLYFSSSLTIPKRKKELVRPTSDLQNALTQYLKDSEMANEFETKSIASSIETTISLTGDQDLEQKAQSMSRHASNLLELTDSFYETEIQPYMK